MANQQLSLGSLNQEISKLRNELRVTRERLDQTANKFCLYWLDDHKPAAFGIVLRQYSRKNPESYQTEEVADLFIITEHLGSAAITFAKKLVEKDVPKAGRWEPLVLPHDLQAEVSADAMAEKEAAPDDGNTALL